SPRFRMSCFGESACCAQWPTSPAATATSSSNWQAASRSGPRSRLTRSPQRTRRSPTCAKGRRAALSSWSRAAPTELRAAALGLQPSLCDDGEDRREGLRRRAVDRSARPRKAADRLSFLLPVLSVRALEGDEGKAPRSVSVKT